MMKMLLLLAVLSSVVALVLLLYSLYRLHIEINHHSTQANKNIPEGLSATTQFVTTSDHFKIAYWYFPVKESKAVVILIHGNSNPGGKTQSLVHAKYLRDAGYSTVVLDLRSFGESDGNKITLGVNEWKDVKAVYDQIKSLPENRNQKVGFFGVSMGAVTALVTRGETEKGDFIIASVPYADFDSLFHFQITQAGFNQTLFYPFVKLAGYVELGLDYEQFTSLKNIPKIHVPVLLISGKNDATVNPQDAKILFDAANEPKEYWQANNGHDIFAENPEEFQQHILSFLEKYVH